jgi:hypothetical protein
MTNNLRNFVVGTFSFLGVLCITSGVSMPYLAKATEKSSVTKLSVTQRKVTNAKSNEIKLKDVKIEVNQLLSLDTADYLANPDDIEDSIVKRLKLDTSNVNTNQVGNYSFTITYNKKIYNGTVMVINKPLPQVSTMTLNSLSFEVGSNLPVDVSSYIKEQLSDEVKAAIILDTSNVDTNKPGSYLYSVSYNGKLYTNTITIYEPKFGVSTDNSLTNSNKEKVTDNNTNNN